MTDRDCPSVHLADQTWPDIEQALADGFDTVVLPLGATEQHGPHLPTGTDTLLAVELAERIARRLGNALVAPAIPVGPSEEHSSFPGTVSISTATVQRLLWDYVDSLAQQGFDRVVVLPGHGGWFPVVQAVYPELAAEVAVDVVTVGSLQRYLEILSEGLDAAGISVEEPVGHAGASETSMLLAIAADAVADERPRGHEGTVSAAALFSDGIETYDADGVLGDARPASADAGETILEHVVEAHLGTIRAEFRELERHRSDPGT